MMNGISFALMCCSGICFANYFARKKVYNNIVYGDSREIVNGVRG